LLLRILPLKHTAWCHIPAFACGNSVELFGAVGPVGLQTVEFFQKTVHDRGDCVLAFLD
jgi:hypothetical protein